MMFPRIHESLYCSQASSTMGVEVFIHHASVRWAPTFTARSGVSGMRTRSMPSRPLPKVRRLPPLPDGSVVVVVVGGTVVVVVAATVVVVAATVVVVDDATVVV